MTNTKHGDIKLSSVPQLDSGVKMADDTELLHYGVKGMRWGVRKRRPSGSSPRAKSSTAKAKPPAKPTARVSSDHVTAQTIKSRKVSELSNAELQMLNRRMELEKKYRDLNPSKIAKGLKIAKQVVDTATTAQKLYKLVKDPLGTGGGKNKDSDSEDKSKGGSVTDRLAAAKAEALKRTMGKKKPSGEDGKVDLSASTILDGPLGSAAVDAFLKGSSKSTGGPSSDRAGKPKRLDPIKNMSMTEFNSYLSSPASYKDWNKTKKK